MYTEKYADSRDIETMTPEMQKVWNETFICRDEILAILHERPLIMHKGFWRSEADITVASYLLAKTFEFDYPLNVSFEDIVAKGLDQTIIELVKCSTCIQDNWEKLIDLTKKYGYNIFCLNALMEVSSDYGDETPDGIVEIAMAILDIKPGDKFADFCCGRGKVALSVKKKYPETKVWGIDYDSEIIALAKIRAELDKLEISFEDQDLFFLEDDDLTHQRRYDKVFSNYPLGRPLYRLGRGEEYKTFVEKKIPAISKATSSDWLFNLRMIDAISETGKAVGIMTNGSAWNLLDAPIRQYLVEKGLIESVIALPDRLYYSTNFPVSLVVFSHNNKGVRLVDASNQYVEGRRINKINKRNIESIIHDVATDSNNSMFVPVDKLRDNDYVLNIRRYLPLAHQFKDGVPFRSVIKRITRGAHLGASELDNITSNVPTSQQYLLISNIHNGIIDDNLPYLTEIREKLERYCLTDRCLILSKNGYPYKIAVAELKDEQQILANGNLYIIEVNEEKVNPYYLAALFSSELGITLLKSISAGATIPNIAVRQLENLIIPLPSLEEQNIIAEKYQTAKDEIALLNNKVEKARAKMANAFEEG